VNSVFQSVLRRMLPPALALATSCAFAAPMYDVKVIAPPERGGNVEMFWFNAIDINNDGKSLTHVTQYMNSYPGFSTFDRHGNNTGLPSAETTPGTGANFVGLNSWGDVIGSVTHLNYIWMGTVLKDQGYEAQVYGLPDDIYDGYYSDSYAYDANDVGQVVGQAKSSTDGRWRAYIWQDKVLVEIGTFGGASSSASAINGRGVVVGSADLADGTTHAFSYRNGLLHDLGTLGGANSSAKDINKKGQIVGTAQQADGLERAFIYSDRVMKPLPTPEGASATAGSINRSGYAVGSYRLDGQYHAFVYDGVAVHRLNDLIDRTGPNPWTIESAPAINDKGWIICDGRRAGDLHATVLMLKPRP
jgi:probable HAF family extracellular repeat protein